jgi:putative transposase
MIDKNHPSLSVGAQCRLLSISRSSLYYELMGETAMNLDLMVKIDKQFLETPFYGVQQMTWHLQNEGHAVNYKRIRRLMRLMRLMPIYQKPDTSRPVKGHKTYPYLLGGLRVERPNQVWCADITYLPMRRGFLYLVAIMDWFTRKVLAWRISNTLEADFCVEALNEAFHKFGPPEIMNTDQGSQFTSFAWTDRLKRVGTRISMDGKGRCLDNIFIERLWRSLKYECVYLHAWETGSQAKAGIGRWITFYVSIRRRPQPCYIDQRLLGVAFGLRGFGAHFLARRSKVSRIRPMSASSGSNFPPCHSSICSCSSCVGSAMASRKSA